MSDDPSIVRNVLGEELSPDAIDMAVRSAASVIPPLVEAWHPKAGRDELPIRRPGELSYFISESEWRAFDHGQEVSLAYERGLTALLYVHRVVINSPMLMLTSAVTRGKPLEWCRDGSSGLGNAHSLEHRPANRRPFAGLRSSPAISISPPPPV
jgi:hypothetical protein